MAIACVVPDELEPSTKVLVEHLDWERIAAEREDAILDLRARLQDCDHPLQTILASRSWRWMCVIRAMVPLPRRRRVG